MLASDLNGLSSSCSRGFQYETAVREHQKGTPGKPFLVKLDYNANSRNKVSFRNNRLSSHSDIALSNRVARVRPATRRPTQQQLSELPELELFDSGEHRFRHRRVEIGCRAACRTTDHRLPSRTRSAATSESVSIRRHPRRQQRRVHVIWLRAVLAEQRTALQDVPVCRTTSPSSATALVHFGVSIEKLTTETCSSRASRAPTSTNTLADFLTEATATCQPNRTTVPVTLRRFRCATATSRVRTNRSSAASRYAGGTLRTSGGHAPTGPVTPASASTSRVWRTEYPNANVDALTFRDETGAGAVFDGKASHPKPLGRRASASTGIIAAISARRSRRTGLHRQAGIRLDLEPIGNTGVLTGFIQDDLTTARPFHPDPNRYKPTTVTGAPASSVDLAMTDPDFKFPQIWRTHIAVDRRLPWGIPGTGEFIYNRDVNGVYYINANLPAAQAAFAGPDTRQRWVGTACNAPTSTPCVTRLHNAAAIIPTRCAEDQTIGRS